MKAIIAIALSIMLPFLGMSGVASAQSAVAVHGTIDAVDCQSQTVVLNTANGQQTIAASDNAYADVDATNLPFCSLEGYVGAPATVWVAASGNQLVATAVTVTGPVAAAPVTAEIVAPLPIWGAVLGTVVVAGLLYLVVHGPDGYYYRYPYYGGYYRYYYHSWYRPYTGFYPASAAVITVALPIVGAVLGTVIVNDTTFLVSRDAAGHIYRYPYWGPYHRYYYRPSYRPYTGANARTYTTAAVRRGDPHWDAPAHAMGVVYHAPVGRNIPQHQAQPANHRPIGTAPHQPQPTTQRPMGTVPHQPQPAYHQATNTHRPTNTNTPPHQPQPAYHQATQTHQPTNTNRPPHQPQPAYHQATQTHQPTNTNTPPHQPQPPYHQPTNTPPHQPQTQYRPAGTSPNQPNGAHQSTPSQQNSRQQCGNQQPNQSNQSCSVRSK